MGCYSATANGLFQVVSSSKFYGLFVDYKLQVKSPIVNIQNRIRICDPSNIPLTVYGTFP